MKKVKAAGTPRIATRVRSAVAAEDLASAERLMRIYRDEHGNTPDALEALSWLARALFAARRFEKAAEYAREAHRLTTRRLDISELQSEPSLASALGASIEVLAQWKDLKGRRSDAARFLKRELAKFELTPVGTRIRKNLNLSHAYRVNLCTHRVVSGKWSGGRMGFDDCALITPLIRMHVMERRAILQASRSRPIERHCQG